MDPAVVSTRLMPARAVEIIDRAFRVYRENFVTFAGISALISVPLTVIRIGVQQSLKVSSDAPSWYAFSETLNRFVLVFMVLVLGYVIQIIVVNGLITYISSENYLGRNPTIARAFRDSRRRLGSLALAFLLLTILFFMLLVAVSFAGALCFPLFFTMPVLFYIGLSLYFFIVPVIMLERVPISKGIHRALHLGKARFWPLSGFVLSMLIISGLMQLAANSITSFLFSASGDITTTVTAVLQMIFSILTMPVLPIGLTLMYYDTRVRLEGLDLLMLTWDRPNARPSDFYSPSPRGWLLNRRDFL
ncbi:MAG TPA: hypothetical protein VHP83_13035, partial [Aggregatilineaceae bacterium]|nr:hypothetical protein [Aggregatilineaceae bacterium]